MTRAREGLRIALVGGGAVTEILYVPALRAHRLLDRVILVDPDVRRAEALVRRFGIGRWSADHRDILGEVDAAIVAVPTYLHAEVSLDFLRRGVPVLCEKPLADTASAARAMLAEATRSGAILAANYTRRLYASYRKVKEVLSAGRFGRPVSIRFVIGDDFKWPTVSGFYFNARVSSRGVVLDRGSHKFDLIAWWLGGKPTLVSCETDSFGGPEAVAQVKWVHDGCEGEVKLSVLGRLPGRFRVECETGTLEGEIYDFRHLVVTPHGGRPTTLRLPSPEKVYAEFGNRLVGNFMAAVAGDQAVLVSGRDVIDSIEFTDECYSAAKRLPMPWYDAVEAARES
jgi:predicted dehydrogenase